ncbi:pre-peptidase C-terminal domain-containing protein [Microbacterium sp.]
MRVSVEVRDADTEEIELSVTGEPDGAIFAQIGDKRAILDWCPTPDQIDASSRWVATIEASDGDHTERLQHTMVLRAETREDCPGAAPTIDIVSPAEGERVASSVGYLVRANVTDDEGLRDAPILYYSQVAPETDEPKLDEFDQVFFANADGAWEARIPSLGLEGADEAPLYVVVSATDNDDDAGTACDHTVDSPVRSFIAAAGSETDRLNLCDSCSASTECLSGICGQSDTGGRCLFDCGEGVCAACEPVTSVEGAIVDACGSVAAQCEGQTEVCTDDGFEDNDTPETAATATYPIDAVVCPSDDDYFTVTLAASMQFDATLDGFDSAEADLDLRLLADDGTVIQSSAGTTSSEQISFCAQASRSLALHVVNFSGTNTPYHLSVVEQAAACCIDDGFEPNQSATAATALTSGEPTSGVACPDDDDYFSFSIPASSTVSFTLAVGNDADLDLDILDSNGLQVARGDEVGSELVTVDLATGDYTARVYGFDGATGPYDLSFTSASLGCTDDNSCPLGTICRTGECVDSACQGLMMCPPEYLCPTLDPSAVFGECGLVCGSSESCREGESCKWFHDGRACGAQGAGQTGAACTSHADCGGERTCVGWAGGYCARSGCTNAFDCEFGSHCATVGSTNICVQDCSGFGNTCREAEGYSCDIVFDQTGAIQWGVHGGVGGGRGGGFRLKVVGLGVDGRPAARRGEPGAPTRGARTSSGRG